MKRSKKQNRIFSESWEYLKESKSYFYAAALLFVLGMIIGVVFPDIFSAYFEDMLKDLIARTQGLGFTGLVWFIFKNNLAAAFFAFVLGIAFSIFPIFTVFFNGLLSGFVLSRAVEVSGLLVVWRLFPHGIFELPAIFISAGLGIKLGLFWLTKKGTKAEEFRRRLWNGIKVFFCIVLPLLVIAAIIEGILIGLSG